MSEPKTQGPSLRVGLLQSRPNPDPMAVSENRAAFLADAESLFAAGAGLVVGPELGHHAYFPRDRAHLTNWAESLNGPTVSAWAAVAHKHGGYIAGSLLERDPEGLVYNTAILVGPRGLIGSYRKMHRFAWEQEWLAPGTQLSLLELESGIRIGLLICYDLRFPEAVRALALAGMDLLVVPTTWTSIGKSQLWDPGGFCPQAHAVIAHAYMNRVAAVAVDRTGQEAAVRFLGASLAVAPDGAVVGGPLSGNDPAHLVVDLPVGESRDKQVGRTNHVFRDRQPHRYTVPQLVREVPRDPSQGGSA